MTSQTKLLCGEHPLILSPKLAVLVGPNASIVLQQLHYRLLQNNNKAHIRDDRVWCWNTYEMWQRDNFPFWTTSQIQRIFAKLEKDKLVITGRFNRNNHDRTKWYTIDYELIDRLISGQVAEIIDDADSDEGRPTSPPSNMQEPTVEGSEQDEQYQEITPESTPKTTTTGGSCLWPSEKTEDLQKYLAEMVAKTKFSSLTLEDLKGLIRKHGLESTFQAVDVLRSGQGPKNGNLVGYIAKAMEELKIPHNFIPFCEIKEKAIQAANAKKKKALEDEAREKELSEIAKRRFIELQKKFLELPESIQNEIKKAAEIRAGKICAAKWRMPEAIRDSEETLITQYFNKGVDA